MYLPKAETLSPTSRSQDGLSYQYRLIGLLSITLQRTPFQYLEDYVAQLHSGFLSVASDRTPSQAHFRKEDSLLVDLTRTCKVQLASGTASSRSWKDTTGTILTQTLNLISLMLALLPG